MLYALQHRFVMYQLPVIPLLLKIDPNPENAKDSSTQETIFSQHLLVCALQELGSLVQGLASSASALLADQVQCDPVESK